MEESLTTPILGKALQEGQLDVPTASLLPAAPELAVGDEACPMKPCLIRPSGSHLPEDVWVFNYRGESLCHPHTALEGLRL